MDLIVDGPNGAYKANGWSWGKDSGFFCGGALS